MMLQLDLQRHHESGTAQLCARRVDASPTRPWLWRVVWGPDHVRWLTIHLAGGAALCVLPGRLNVLGRGWGGQGGRVSVAGQTAEFTTVATLEELAEGLLWADAFNPPPEEPCPET